jgi:hypothetical protein
MTREKMLESLRTGKGQQASHFKVATDRQGTAREIYLFYENSFSQTRIVLETEAKQYLSETQSRVSGLFPSKSM